jgi:hypothetical protein
MSWPSAMNVSAAVCETAVLGQADAVLGDEAETLDDAVGAAEEADAATVVGMLDADEAAELPDELHAVTSTAAHPGAAQTATCLALREFVINMISTLLLTLLAAQRAVASTTPAAPPWLGSPAYSCKPPALMAA